MPNPIEQLSALGQSLWLDHIQRRQLEDGQLAEMIAGGEIRGMTSNPTIFLHAIASSHDYDPALQTLAWSGWKAEEIFWQLVIEDVVAACDLFLPLYRASDGSDGYVSLEVKIPATRAGVPAIRATIAAGINVNATLIFSLERYREVMDAYLAGLEDRLQAGLPVETIASVASFFVSRMDTKVDQLLEGIDPVRAKGLFGKSAIANARLAYAEFNQIFGGTRFARFQAAGCRPQRPLWASTGTKNPAYPDTLYVDSLIGPASVNTLPPQTLEAFRDHGKAEASLLFDLEPSRQVLAEVEAAGISIHKVTRELEVEGIKAFADAFRTVLRTIDDRRREFVLGLGPLAASVGRRVAHLEAQAVPARLQAGDPTLWTFDPDGQKEIRIRMGWLKLPESARLLVKDIRDFCAEIRRNGFTHVLLLGMGGSSLAPEVMALSFSLYQKEAVHFSILDSTDPAQVLECVRAFPVEKTLVIVSSKSGGTTEVNALFDFFWERAGHDGSRFIAITDPGTSLEGLANARGFRKIFRADPAVGGRYSALTAFGLVPAGLLGIDPERPLGRAAWMARQCAGSIPAVRNPGLVLGAILGQAALAGRDKVTLIADPETAPFGSWLEQLIAESSGKQGRGFVPVDGEPVGEPQSYGEDRLFVYLRRGGDHAAEVKALQEASQPVIVFDLPDPYELGAEFYRWEMATTVGCSILGVNAFDQPDVQDSKDRTKTKLIAYSQSRRLEEGTPAWEKDGIGIYTPGPVLGVDLRHVVDSFLHTARRGDYVAINAYLPRNPVTAEALQELRLTFRERTGCATTVGFGPRFQHSTGQLHKGGPNRGLFLQITTEPDQAVEIPNQHLTFAILERAQALGDYEALMARKRRLMRIHLPSLRALPQLVQALKSSGPAIPDSDISDL